MEEELFERSPEDLAVDFESLNKLIKLGNQAISLKLIAGHGFHGSKYEIIHQGKILLMSPEEAEKFLEDLIKEIGN